MTIKDNNSGNVNISFAPHPFAVERINSKVNAGLSILEIIQTITDIKEYIPYAHVYIDGEYIEQKNWHLVKPKAGAIVTIRAIPQGGGGGSKNPLRTILSIAVMAGTGFLATGLTAAIGGSTFLGLSVSGIAVSGVNLLGKLVLNAIAPPSSSKLSSSSESSVFYIQGAKNSIKPFERIPKVLGKHRFVPPLGAMSYTELVGDDQYLRMLFVWGYGPLAISDLKIGETPLEEFDDVEIETRYGYEDDEDLTLYTNSVLQNDLQVYLKNEDGYIVRTTEDAADEISVDITMPNGLVYYKGDGSKKNASVSIAIEYALSGTEDWIVTEGISLTAQQSTAIRKGLRFKVENGKYDVRIKRLTADKDDDNENLFDTTIWTALRTIRYESPINKTGLAVTAMRIKATDQLNGVVDKFNGVVEAIIPDWNGKEWADAKTSNPASIYRHILQGNANARPVEDERIDFSVIEAWHENCANNNREFNTVIDYDISVIDLLRDVAASGRASPSMIDGKWSVIEDKVREYPVQHFTPRNTYNFNGEKSFDDLPHALRVRFINRDEGWQQDERIVYDNGYSADNATKFETLEFNGVTDAEQVWRDARYHLATARLRPEIFSFYTDIEHIVCTRGDMIRFTHDVPMFGLASGRIKSLIKTEGKITGVILDCEVEIEAGKKYCLRIRNSVGSTILKDILTQEGASNVITFKENVSDIAVGDLVMFGIKDSESVPLVVKSIQPQGELKAKITCVAYDEDIFNADNLVVPSFKTNITTSASSSIPTPVLKQIQSGLETVIKHTDGSLTSRIVISLVKPENVLYEFSVSVKIKAGGETYYRTATVLSRTSSEISITDIVEGELYDIQLRYIDGLGVMSQPLTILNHRVEGTTALPDDVAGLELNVLGDNIYLNWPAVADIDLSHYVLKYSSKVNGASWGSSTALVTKISKDATSISVPNISGSYLLKAVDIGGRESANPIIATSNVDNIYSFNAIVTLTEDNEFSGEKVSTSKLDKALTLVGNDLLDDFNVFDEINNIDYGLNGVASSGIYNFSNSLDLGAVYTSRVTADIDVLGKNIYDTVDSYILIDEIESWDSSIDPSLFGINLQLKITNDNPESENAVWSEWKNFVVGDYAARAFKFRVILLSNDNTVAPVVYALSVNIDMPDRIETGDNIVTDNSLKYVSFTNPFKEKPVVSVLAQNMQSGDYFTTENITNAGFGVTFYNSAGEAISRSFDYIAKGYGLSQLT